MTSLFERGAGLPRAARAHGCWVTDTAGNRYLDGSSGALVVNVGHDDSLITSAIRRQLDSISYAHPTAFGSDVTDAYADQLATRLPMEDPAIYPVSGGSEAVETALKVARAYHLAKGHPERSIVIGRELSYHGNTRGALDVSGRDSLRAPYLPWLGLSSHVPGVLEYRCPNPNHPNNCALWHATLLDGEIERLGADRVAAFIAEPVGGAASGAAVPPARYWEEISAVCKRHGVLLIADEVMTGFGRTGAWFASTALGLRPDIMTMAKGASGGYWPLGVCAFSGAIAMTLRESGLTHGFTFSHHIVGAAAGTAVIKRIDQLGLCERAQKMGAVLENSLRAEIGEHPLVGDIRGIGLLWAIELVSDRSARRPFPLAEGMAGRLANRARDHGLVVYPSTGSAGSGQGDLIMVGPPLIIREEEIEVLVTLLSAALDGLR